MMVVLVSATPMTVVPVLHTDAELKALCILRIQAPSLGAFLSEEAVRTTSGKDNKTGMGHHNLRSLNTGVYNHQNSRNMLTSTPAYSEKTRVKRRGYSAL
jgi:hypothetical protein